MIALSSPSATRLIGFTVPRQLKPWKWSELNSTNIRLRLTEALGGSGTSRWTCPHSQKPPSHCETLLGWEVGRWALGRRDWLGCEGALQVHVEDQTSGQQLLLVLVEAREGVEDGGAAVVHPVGKHAAGRANAGGERLVVVELQLAREPAAISNSITAGWRTWLASVEALLHKTWTLSEFFLPIICTLWCQRGHWYKPQASGPILCFRPQHALFKILQNLLWPFSKNVLVFSSGKSFHQQDIPPLMELCCPQVAKTWLL